MVTATSEFGNNSPQYKQMEAEQEAIAAAPIPKKDFSVQPSVQAGSGPVPLRQFILQQSPAPRPQPSFWDDMAERGNALMSILKAGGAQETSESLHLREIGGLQLRG